MCPAKSLLLLNSIHLFPHTKSIKLYALVVKHDRTAYIHQTSVENSLISENKIYDSINYLAVLNMKALWTL